MTCLLRYVRETGAIRGVYTSSNPALLAAQPPPDAPTEAHLLLDTDLLPEDLQRRFRIRDGQLVAAPAEEDPVCS